MTEKEHQKLKDRIEQEYREKLKALELIWQLAQNASGNGRLEGQQKRETTTGKGKLLNAIRQALMDIHGQFSIYEVEKGVQSNSNNTGQEVLYPETLSSLWLPGIHSK
jgi:hypothetical protein